MVVSDHVTVNACIVFHSAGDFKVMAFMANLFFYRFKNHKTLIYVQGVLPELSITYKNYLG